MSKNVEEFYTKKGWQKKNNNYTDSILWEDNRKYVQEYVSKCRKKLNRYIPNKGNKILDFASGPIQYKEYIEYSKNFNKRVCIDLSQDALDDAKAKIGEHGEFIKGDILKLQLQESYYDCIISLHTIYHISSEKQYLVVNKLIDSIKHNKPIIIIYSNPNSIFFYIKKFIRVFIYNASIKKIYFHAHPIKWWYQFSDRVDIKIISWRFMSSEDQKRLIPNNNFGKFVLKIIFNLENLFPSFFARFSQYPIIILKKK